MAKFEAAFPNSALMFRNVKDHPEFPLNDAMIVGSARFAPFQYGFCLGFISKPSWYMINEWLRSDAVPGRFVLGSSGYMKTWVEAVYGFDDPHAAFLFKMRWR